LKFKVKLFSIIAIFLILSGCSVNDFFDTETSIKSPKLAPDQQNLKETIFEYLNSDFIWSYVLVNDRYSTLTECKLKKEKEEIYKIAFCKSNEETRNLHVMILKEDEISGWKVLDEIILEAAELERVCIKEKENKIELILLKNSSLENDLNHIETYYYD